MSNINVKFKMDKISDIMERRNLNEKGQKMLDNEVMRVMEPYMPKREPPVGGTMIDSMFDTTEPGSGEVVVNTPYAHRRLKSARHNGLRGPDYFERMKTDNKEHLLSFMAKATGGKAEK